MSTSVCSHRTRRRPNTTARISPQRAILAVNLMGTPGAGKTALLEATIAKWRGSRRIVVIEGDQATDRDSARIRAAGATARQVETGLGCHLDAHQIHDALHHLDLRDGDLLFIENVGNLVCPALFDLGERLRVVVTSPTEGADKPLKYPPMFRAAHLVVLNKCDLIAARAVQPRRMDRIRPCDQSARADYQDLRARRRGRRRIARREIDDVRQSFSAGISA